MKRTNLDSLCWIAACATLASFAGSTARAQEKPAKPAVEVKRLGDTLYRLCLPPVNLVACAGPDGTLLVDAGYEQMGDAIKAELAKIGASDVRFVVDTHWHFDHAGGNKVFGPRALIMAHRSALDLLSTDQVLLDETQKAHPVEARPKLAFDGVLELRLNGERITVTPVPGGHTGGDVVVLFEKANVLHIGDLVFPDQFPFVDLEHGGDVVKLAENIQKVIAMAPPGVRIVPGHGRDLTIEDLSKYREMLLATTEIVRKQVRAGKSLEAIREADALKDYSAWDGSFTRGDWIEIAYRSLTR